MKFSILIPFFNSANFLDKCLQSCLDQTFLDFEIICLNDGGNDKSIDVIKKYQNIDKRIHLYENDKNYGLSFCRNKLISLANGEYFFFLDSDDWIHKKTLQWINNKIISKGSVDIISSKSYVCYKFHKIFIKLPFFPTSYRIKMDKFDFVKSNICTPWGHAIRIDFWKEMKIPDFLVDRSFEDIGLMPYVILKSNSFMFLNRKIYFYYKRKKTLSSFSSEPYKKAIDIIAELNNLVSHFYNDNLLNNKRMKKSINGTYIVAILAVVMFMTRIDDDNELNDIVNQIEKLFITKKIEVDFSKTWWKSISYFIISINLFFSFNEVKKIKKYQLKSLKHIFMLKRL